MWILTEEYNDYNQYGEYFVAAWIEKPSREQLLKELSGTYGVHGHAAIAENLLMNGGGRIDTEYHWYNLCKYEEKT